MNQDWRKPFAAVISKGLDDGWELERMCVSRGTRVRIGGRDWNVYIRISEQSCHCANLYFSPLDPPEKATGGLPLGREADALNAAVRQLADLGYEGDLSLRTDGRISGMFWKDLTEPEAVRREMRMLRELKIGDEL